MIAPADYPTGNNRQIAIDTRPIGLGFANLGAYLMLKGLPYDSEEARKEASWITREMSTAAYQTSIELAAKLKPYLEYKNNKERNEYLVRHLTDIITPLPETGLRNSQLTCLAPTGTISFLMDCDTTGIEPLFALKSYKQLAGGGVLEIVPKCIEKAWKKYGYILEKNKTLLENMKEVFECDKNLKALFNTANEISPKDHMAMMAACQPYLNGAISKTINMPSEATVEEVEAIYMEAWKSGLKSVAIYRYGCKMLQPLVESIDKEEEIEEVTEPNEEKWTAFRRKLPDTRQAMTHKFDIAGLKGYITYGLYDSGDLGEIFIRTQKQGTTVDGLMDSMATAVSLGLQYGVPVETFVDKFVGSKFEPSGITTNEDIRVAQSVIDYIFRWIKLNFMDDDEDDEQFTEQLNHQKKQISFDGPPCPRCQTITGRSGSCYVCNQCGETTGCS
jgi:ribonucleoside-diphosphate reductase alpha chain